MRAKITGSMINRTTEPKECVSGFEFQVSGLQSKFRPQALVTRNLKAETRNFKVLRSYGSRPLTRFYRRHSKPSPACSLCISVCARHRARGRARSRGGRSQSTGRGEGSALNLVRSSLPRSPWSVRGVAKCAGHGYPPPPLRLCRTTIPENVCRLPRRAGNCGELLHCVGYLSAKFF